jgi:hypothetical protein
VQFLVDRWASFKTENWEGETAPLIAASSGIKRVVQLLLDKGIDMEAKDERQRCTRQPHVDMKR